MSRNNVVAHTASMVSVPLGSTDIGRANTSPPKGKNLMMGAKSKNQSGRAKATFVYDFNLYTVTTLELLVVIERLQNELKYRIARKASGGPAKVVKTPDNMNAKERRSNARALYRKEQEELVKLSGEKSEAFSKVRQVPVDEPKLSAIVVLPNRSVSADRNNHTTSRNESLMQKRNVSAPPSGVTSRFDSSRLPVGAPVVRVERDESEYHPLGIKKPMLRPIQSVESTLQEIPKTYLTTLMSLPISEASSSKPVVPVKAEALIPPQSKPKSTPPVEGIYFNAKTGKKAVTEKFTFGGLLARK